MERLEQLTTDYAAAHSFIEEQAKAIADHAVSVLGDADEEVSQKAHRAVVSEMRFAYLFIRSMGGSREEAEALVSAIGERAKIDMASAFASAKAEEEAAFIARTKERIAAARKLGQTKLADSMQAKLDHLMTPPSV